jgi:hypothetical protein
MLMLFRCQAIIIFGSATYSTPTSVWKSDVRQGQRRPWHSQWLWPWQFGRANTVYTPEAQSAGGLPRALCLSWPSICLLRKLGTVTSNDYITTIANCLRGCYCGFAAVTAMANRSVTRPWASSLPTASSIALTKSTPSFRDFGALPQRCHTNIFGPL